MPRTVPTICCWLLVSLLAGCATPVQVTYDEARDFSGFRTWTWLPGEAIVVHAPFENEAAIRGLLARGIERALSPRGLERGGADADLRVGVVLTVARDHRTYAETGAVQTLTSFKRESYEAQSQTISVRVVDRCRLGVYVADARDRRLIWEAVVDETHTGGCRPHLEDALAHLLESYPPS